MAGQAPAYDFAVVGLGRMGASIAGQLALRGCRVAMYDRSNFDREKGKNIMSADLKDHVEKGLITAEEKDAAMGRGKLVADLTEVVNSAVVIEAIFEDLGAKKELFRLLEEAAGTRHPGTIFTTNSINFSVVDITREVVSMERTVCGLRFLHPVWFIPDVEVSGPWSTPPVSYNALLDLLKKYEFKPFFYNSVNPSGFMRRRLDMSEVAEFQRQQKARAPRPQQPPRAPLQDAPRAAANSADEDSQCVVCAEVDADCLFAPCGHKVMCMGCARRWWDLPNAAGRPCPTCRQRVERLLAADE